MRVLIDAHMVGQKETGNETYILGLLKQFSLQKDVEFGALFSSAQTIPNIEPLTSTPMSSLSRLAWGMVRAANKWKADLLHLTYNGPFVSNVPFVVSVHDVSFRRFPEFFSPRDRLLFSTLLPYTLRTAKTIITISNHAQQEIEYFYPFTKGKVFPIHLAADPTYDTQVSPNKEEVLRQYGLGSAKYMLAVGNIQPRKNLARLVRAFSSLQTKFPDIQLLIVGKAQWKSSEIYRFIQESGLENRVIFTGYINQIDLKSLYQCAELYIYPSLYEGFGLPILEAMACGAPVVTSQVSSMPEVAGDAAEYVDPTNIDSIAAGLECVLSNPDHKNLLRQKGFRQAASFSWEKTARETIELYKNAVR